MLRVIRVKRLSAAELGWCAALAILTLVVLMLVRTRTLGSAEPPVALPLQAVLTTDGAEAWCDAVQEFRAGRTKEATASFKRASDEIVAPPDHVLSIDPSLALWKTLVAHRGDNLEVAISGWKLAALPAESEVWRNVALAAAYLAKGEVIAANRELAAALKRAPDNPVVHYYVAILRLEEAATASTWPDAAEPTQWKLVGLPTIVPNSKAMFRLAAAEELERAVATADRIEMYRPLIPANATIEPAFRPVVGDLLFAIRGEHLHATAHNMLGHLLLETGALERAEHHLDAATKLDADVLDGYTELSDLYAATGRHLDAARADLKAAHNGPAHFTKILPALRHFKDAMADLAP